MTASHSRQGLLRRSLTALPLLLVPLLMTACSSPAGSASPGSAASSGASASAASAGASASPGGDLYKKVTTGEQLCALVPLADVSAAMQVKPAFTSAKPTTSPLECTYSSSAPSSIVSVAWNPEGAGLLDSYLAASSKTKPVAIDVGGHSGRSLNGDVQVVVGDVAIDVFGVSPQNLKQKAALAAAFAQKVG